MKRAIGIIFAILCLAQAVVVISTDTFVNYSWTRTQCVGGEYGTQVVPECSLVLSPFNSVNYFIIGGSIAVAAVGAVIFYRLTIKKRVEKS